MKPVVVAATVLTIGALIILILAAPEYNYVSFDEALRCLRC